MIIYTTGNIWKSTCKVIVVTVNCLGAMGAGIARQCRNRYPATYEQYQRKCKRGEYYPGKPILTNVDRPLLLFPTKDDWREDSKYEWISEGLDRIAKNADKFESIAIPPLGCGHGNLDWEGVKSLIEQKLGHLPNRIEVYPPKRQKGSRYTTETLRNDKDEIHTKSTLENICIAVTGGRDYQNKSVVFSALDKINAEHKISLLIHGGARGADTLCRDWAVERNIPVELHNAEWDRLGKRAGIIRNQRMLDRNPDAVVAFPGGRGTGHMVDSAKQQGFEVIDAESLIE